MRFKNKDISKREYALWVFFWLIVIIATLIPKNLDQVAQFVGVERGADLAIYLSIIVIFYLIFKILVHLDKIDREITQIVRKMALDKNETKDNKKSNRL